MAPKRRRTLQRDESLHEDISSSSAAVPRKRQRAGSIGSRYHNRDLQPGPTSVDEAFNWPLDKVEKVVGDQERKLRLMSFMMHGVGFTSDYSGFDCPRECLTQLDTAFTIKDWPWQGQGQRFEFLRSCDRAQSPQSVLLHLARVNDKGCSCVFSDINDRLDEETTVLVDKMEPNKVSELDRVTLADGFAARGSTERGHMARAYADMQAWFMDKRASLFNRNTKSYCLVHEKDCFAYPCMENRKVADEKRLLFNISGNVCWAWSSCGQHAADAHESERTFGIWAAERKSLAEQNLEDGFFEECTSQFPVARKIAAPLASSHHVVWVTTCPGLQGFPTTRPRVFSAGLNRKGMAWLGPSKPEDIQADFDSIFSTTMELSGHVFFRAETPDIVQDLQKRLRDRGNHSPVADVASASEDGGGFILDPSTLECFLPPGATQRFWSYDNGRAANEGVGGAFLADVEHWPGQRRGLGGPLFPCQLTHGTVVDWESMRPATPMESLSAQGFHVLGDLSLFKSPLANFLRTLSRSKLLHLVGNGINLPAFAAWILYVWSNSARMLPPQLQKPMSFSIAFGEDSLLEAETLPMIQGAEGAEQEAEESDAKEEEEDVGEFGNGDKAPEEEEHEEAEEEKDDAIDGARACSDIE